MRESDREKAKEREREKERGREEERESVRKRERERERCRKRPELLFLFSKGMMGALAPFSYLVFQYLPYFVKLVMYFIIFVLVNANLKFSATFWSLLNFRNCSLVIRKQCGS